MGEERDKKRFMIFISLAIMVLITMLLGNLIALSVIKELNQSINDSPTVIDLTKKAVLTLVVNAFVGLIGLVLGGFGLYKRRLFFMSETIENEPYKSISVFIMLGLFFYGAYIEVLPFIEYSELITKAFPEIFKQ